MYMASSKNMWGYVWEGWWMGVIGKEIEGTFAIVPNFG